METMPNDSGATTVIKPPLDQAQDGNVAVMSNSEGKKGYHPFTAEFAAEMRERKRQKALLAAQSPKPPATPPPTELPADLDEFTARRLVRVRKQLDMLDAEVDAAIPDRRLQDRVKPLVEAQSRLSEQERFLANRPGPGTRKPKAEPVSRRSADSCEPLDE